MQGQITSGANCIAQRATIAAVEASKNNSIIGPSFEAYLDKKFHYNSLNKVAESTVFVVYCRQTI